MRSHSTMLGTDQLRPPLTEGHPAAVLRAASSLPTLGTMSSHAQYNAGAKVYGGFRHAISAPSMRRNASPGVERAVQQLAEHRTALAGDRREPLHRGHRLHLLNGRQRRPVLSLRRLGRSAELATVSAPAQEE
jgi:hypothetical protein